MHAYDLRADARIDPSSISSGRPRLSWRLRSPHNGDVPAFVCIEAAATREALLAGDADLWRSSPTASSEPSIEWGGTNLGSRDRVHWRVAVLATADEIPTWSDPAVFEIALLSVSEWVARWVTHPDWRNAPNSSAPSLPVIGTTITTERPVKRARAYVAGAGVFTMSINGRPASDDRLSPGYSRLDRRVGGVVWDVTDAFQPGANEVAFELGTGMGFVERLPGRYTKLESDALLPRILAQIELEFDDGTRLISGSGRGWRTWLGATTIGHWYGGEDADARRTAHPLEEGPAVELGPTGLHQVWWSERPPIRTVEELDPISVTRHEGGSVRVIDFGVNIAGIPLLRLRHATPGQTIRFVPAEILDADGRVTQWSTGGPTWDAYTTRGGDQEWSPQFVYHGFRYLEVRGLDLGVADDSVTALVLRSTNTVASEFSTSDVFLSTLHRMIDRAVQGNMFSVFTDCPHREKLGWLEQLHLCFDTLARNYDVAAHLRDELVHMRDAQLPSGGVPSIAPESVDFSGITFEGDANAFREDPNWGGALVLVSWRLYENYGDRRALEESWSAILDYLRYLESRASRGILDFGLGDWVALDGSTPRAMVATFGYGRILDATARIGEVLGDSSAERFAARSREVREAFRARFGPDGRNWGSGSQASYALALDFGVVQPEDASAVLAKLLESISRAGDRLTVGENTLPSLLTVLHASGHDDVIDRVVRNTEAPGYGYQVHRGLTALAEKWTIEDGEGVDASLNHFMLGMIDTWITADLVGLHQHEDSIGWRRVRVAPTVLPGITRMSTRFESPFGAMHVAWEAGERFTLSVLVPPGVTGVVEVPALNGGASPRSLDGLTPSGEHGEPTRRFEIGSGRWSFES